MSSILLRYLNAHPTLAPTYILSGPLKSTSKLAQTQLEPIGPASPGATQSLAHLATQGVKIVDMDQMSDADRNSEPDEADEMGMRNEDGWPGNDEGAEDGLVGDGLDRVEREDDVVVNEEVPRWGMVLVQGDLLEGGFNGHRLLGGILRSQMQADADWARTDLQRKRSCSTRRASACIYMPWDRPPSR